jgi:hypothetical protein
MVRFLKNSFKIQLFVVIAASVVFWIVAHQVLGVREAWDSENFLWAYLLAIALTSFFGALFDQNYIFSELLVMIVVDGFSPFLLVGILTLFFLAMPAVGTAWLAAKAAAWFDRNRRASEIKPDH